MNILKRSQNSRLFLLIAIGFSFLVLSCSDPFDDAPGLRASTIIFADGEDVVRQLGSGEYINQISGAGSGAISYTSDTPATATVNSTTGVVTLVGIGTTVITASKAETATHSAISASYTLMVSLTSVTISEIPGVAAPVTGATPVRTITETDQYTGTMNWNGLMLDHFSPSTVYTAHIFLTAKDGYTFSGLPDDFFMVAGAASQSYPSDSQFNLFVLATFPATFGPDYTSENIGTLKYVPAGSFQRDVTTTNISVIT